MKILSILLFAILFFSCRGTKFSYETDSTVTGWGKKKPIVIDKTYTLYVRKVVKVFDPNIGMYRPANAPKASFDTLIEVQFLLLSEKNNNVIVFNNIPSIYQNLGKNPAMKNNLTSDNTEVNIDIWYFRQFRFGRYEKDSSSIAFDHANSNTENHLWHIKKDNDSIMLTSISVRDKYGETEGNADQAFALNITYYKAKDFKLVFIYKKNNKPLYELPDQTFYIIEKGKESCIVFRFNQPVNGSSDNNVVFAGKRMYTPL
jgi:hypothetical protein